VTTPVLDADQKRPARGNREGDDRLEGSFRRRQLVLELARPALRALEQFDPVHGARKSTRKTRPASIFRAPPPSGALQTTATVLLSTTRHRPTPDVGVAN